MKKMILSLSMLMIMGTSTSFGKTNGQPRENNNQPRTEMRQDNGRNNQQNVRQDGGRSQQNTGRTYKVDCGRRGNSQPVHQPQPQPRHNSTVDKVTTGVVIGSVVVGLISSLVK